MSVDHGGCLTCHRYPGLVKYEKPDKFRVLHIDEEKQLASKHGKTDCRECHPKTVKIPHTGVTEVECTTGCHTEDREKIDAMGPAALAGFHKDEVFSITRLDDKTSCRVCHPLYPHSANNKVRAFVNMHIGFMMCEVCHLKKEDFNNLVYDWNEPEEFVFTGEPYGTHRKEEVKSKAESGSFVSKMLRMFDEEEESADEVRIRHLISRIAVFRKDEKGKSLFVNTQDNEKAAEFLEKEKDMSPAEKAKELDYFHREIAKKEISVACNECHSATGILDFRKLGFDSKKAKDLQYLNIKSLLTKYDKFVIPNLFGPKKRRAR